MGNDPPIATIDDLYLVKEKAELIDGVIVHLPPHGCFPAAICMEILISLREFTKHIRRRRVYGGKLAYALPRPLKNGRLSFSPDVSYFTGPLPANRMKFIEGTPTFAVEVRSEGDYTPAAEREIAAKRADYFEAGTLVVWDVDPVAKTIRSFTSSAPSHPMVFRLGDVAHAEPAVRGWTVQVAELFAV
jgi:Uma2 family endonuclease